MATKTATKKPALEDALRVLETLFPKPALSERMEDPLIDHLLVAVLGWHIGEQRAREAVRALSLAFIDMNEARSSPLAELTEVLRPHLGEAADVQAICWDLRMALQDVWDGTHGLDLEPLRGRDPEDQRGFLRSLPNTLGGPAALVFQLALGDRHLALGPRERHLLSRLGMLPRASTPQRVRQAVERKIKPAERVRFTWLLGAAAHLYEEDWDEKHPFCQLLIGCKAKEIAERERAQKREEARRILEEKKRQKEEEKRQKELERERLKREREEAKRRKAEERKAKEEARKKAAAEKEAARRAAKAEAVRQRQEARKKAEAERKKAAEKKKAEQKKRAEQKKKAEAKRKADAKRKAEAERKKAAAERKKAAAQKQKAAGAKKAAPKKSASKKPAAKSRAATKSKSAPKKKTAAKAKKKTVSRKK